MVVLTTHVEPFEVRSRNEEGETVDSKPKLIYGWLEPSWIPNNKDDESFCIDEIKLAFESIESGERLIWP